MSQRDGITSILIGSNEGGTTRASLEHLLEVAGPPRTNLAVGIVSFANAFFHPKVFHFSRIDGSATSYVGSANLTRDGVCKHLEAGILLDTIDGDPPAYLTRLPGLLTDGSLGRVLVFFQFLFRLISRLLPMPRSSMSRRPHGGRGCFQYLCVTRPHQQSQL